MIDNAASVSVQIVPLVRYIDVPRTRFLLTNCDLRSPTAFERKNLINEKFPWVFHTHIDISRIVLYHG